ncbi:hypothetical protein EI94DRAFT_1624653 [Lactarius quietus]|nr:hypothetical protein EI94DRAFT_1624653 [Lactarius quietus]
MFLSSFGTPQFSPVLFQNVQVVGAQSDDGPYWPPVGISPHSLSAGFQNPLAAVPTDPPVGAAPAAQASTGPIRNKFVCHLCGQGKYDLYTLFSDTRSFFLESARKSNMKSHMETHNPDRKRPFVCPESDCAHPFTRSNDLKRHLLLMHGRAE